MDYSVPPYVTVVERTILRLDVRRVIIHRNVTMIAQYVFYNWANLKEIVFESGSRLKCIGAYAFVGTALKGFTAPDCLREIENCAFAGCKNLREVRLNEGLESLGECVF